MSTTTLPFASLSALLKNATKYSALFMNSGDQCPGASKTTSPSRNQTAIARSIPPSQHRTTVLLKSKSAPKTCTVLQNSVSPHTLSTKHSRTAAQMSPKTSPGSAHLFHVLAQHLRLLPHAPKPQPFL